MMKNYFCFYLYLLIMNQKSINNYQFNHGEAKLSFLGNVSGFRNKDAPFVLVKFFHFFWSFRQNLTCLKTCLWNPGTYRHKVVLLSSAQNGLVMISNHGLKNQSTPSISLHFFQSSDWQVKKYILKSRQWEVKIYFKLQKL